MVERIFIKVVGALIGLKLGAIIRDILNIIIENIIESRNKKL